MNSSSPQTSKGTFPTEIWEQIIRQTIEDANLWAVERFHPPPRNERSSTVLRLVNTLFAYIVDMIAEETTNVEYIQDLESLSAGAQRRLRSMCIGQPVALSMANKLSNLTHLSTLSITADNNPFQSVEAFPCYGMLTRLTLRANILLWVPLKVVSDQFRHSPLELKALEELRLIHCHSVHSPYSEKIPSVFAADQDDLIAFANAIFNVFSASRCLRLLSVNVSCSPKQAYDSAAEIHYASIAHLVPSEGYERSFATCPLCLELIDQEKTIEWELSATRFLGERWKKLEVVLWSDLFGEGDGQSRQRPTWIIKDSIDPEQFILKARDSRTCI